MFNGYSPRWAAPIATSAAALVACSAARADFSVSYNAQDHRISVIDNATGAVVVTPNLAVHQATITPRIGSTDTTLEPTVAWTPHGTGSHADGLDLTFTFDNSAGAAPARPGPIFVPGIVFGLPTDQLGTIHSRDFYRDGKAFALSPDRPNSGWNTAQQLLYPGTLYSPLAFLNAGHYAVGVSVLYPVADPDWGSLGPSPNEYGHRIGLSVQLPNPEDGQRAWRVRIALADSDLANGDPDSVEGFVPAHQVRSYTVCIRVTDRLRPTVPEDLPVPLPENEPDAAMLHQEWLRLFAPYKDYFASRYGGIRYTTDPRPVLGCTTTQIPLMSPSNPYAFVDFPGGGGRPFPDGWGRWHTHLQAQRAGGWRRYMLWTPSGLFPADSEYNFPFQFTSQWAQQHVEGGEPTMLRDLTDTQPNGSRLGLWWGNSALVMRSWPPKIDSGVSTLDPTNPQHQALVRAELDGAVNIANAGMIGLDAFTLPPWKSYRWLRQLQTWYPGLHFIQEAQPCDIMSTLAPGFIAGTRTTEDADLAVVTPTYLAEFLVPGHEQWASLEAQLLAQELGHSPSDAELIAKGRYFAERGYVPVVFDNLAIGATDIIAARPDVVPCDLLYPRVAVQPPALARAASGQPLAITATFTSEATNTFHWQRSTGSDTWTDMTDTGAVSGTTTQTLRFASASQSDAGVYRLKARDQLGCVDVLTTTVVLAVCGSPDFDHDGDSATDADIEAFFACLAGNCCAMCDTTDFNGDTETGTDADIESFFSALAGGGC